MAKDTKDDHSAMVDWYNPWQLLETAKKTAISTIIGENADPRVVAAAAADGRFFDYSEELEFDEATEFKKDGGFRRSGAPRGEIWIDYASDVGDGWNPTYSIAYALAQETLRVPGEIPPVGKLGKSARAESENRAAGQTDSSVENNDGFDLRRGELLIFGGDGVYPTANPEEYGKKLIKPYRMAFNSSRRGGGADSTDQTDLQKNPHVFVLPGNHDWYDSLVAFQNLFCTHIFNRRKFAGGWRTRQERSYFTLRLPHGWWLLGVDLQLSHNIDARQLEYFESILAHMRAGDKVILCVPEPYWVKALKYHDFGDAAKKFEKKEESIERLERLLADKFPENPIEIKLYIAGDLHHYRRFESEDGARVQKITAGGGGAFLHPTNDVDFGKAFAGKKMSEKDFTVEAQYPPPEVSAGLDWKNLYGFIFNSPYFGFLTAILYFLLAWLVQGEVAGDYDLGTLVKITINRAVDNPLATLTVVLMLGGLIFFTDSNSKLQKYLGGLIHGLAHLAAIFALGWLSFFAALYFLKTDTFGYAEVAARQPTLVNLIWLGCAFVICTVGGYVIGSLIMGVYLFISFHFLKRHDNEAFSALRIEDYKNFLRLRITKDALTIYPLKIERVGRKWRLVEKDGGDYYQPDAPLTVELIENPVVLESE